MKKLLLVLVTLCPSSIFAGQHSGLGGGSPPKAPPPESPTKDSALDEYNRWIQQQIEDALKADPQRPQK